MNKKEYEDWCSRTGHITCNDWNYQTIGEYDYFFIINPKTDKFALIRYDKKNLDRQVILKDWTDFNGYAEKFHQETEGFYK